MSNGEVMLPPPPGIIRGPLSTEQLLTYFSQRSDLTYRTLEDLNLVKVDIYQSLLTGVLVRNSVFDQVIFSRSDLNGVRIERCTFTSCDFTSCDFRSSIFTNCRFADCILDSAFIDDCEFQMCEFSKSSFKVSSLTNCKFKESSLRSCDLTQASFLHNKLYGSTITDMVLGNCALQYVILRNCTLENVTLSAESVGAMFGLTAEEISKAKLVYLGKNEPIPHDSELMRMLFDEYGKRKWYVGQLVLALNFQLASAVSAFDAYLSLSGERFIKFGFASGEELEFLGDVIQELAASEQMPFLTMLNVLDWCTQLETVIKKNNQGLSESSGDALSTLASRLALLANTLLDNLDQASPELNSSDEHTSLCVRITFDKKPDIPLTELLNSLAAQSNGSKLARSRHIRSEVGSYSEIILTTLFTLMAFQAFLFLINGCVIQLTELKHRTKVLARRKAPKSYSDLALSPVQNASPAVLSVLSGLSSYVKGLVWLRHPGLSGYAATNIKSLKETDCDDEGAYNPPQ